MRKINKTFIGLTHLMLQILVAICVYSCEFFSSLSMIGTEDVDFWDIEQDGWNNKSRGLLNYVLLNRINKCFS